MRLDGGGERREVDPEPMRNPVKVLEADVAEAALDPADIRHVKSCQIGDILLCQVPGYPQVPDRSPESDEQRSAVGGHSSTLWPP